MNQNNLGFFSSIPPVTKNIIIINILFWLATITLPRVGIDLVHYLGLHYFLAESFNPAQIVTYMFLHDPSSFTHVFFNMFSVFMFGRALEYRWGSKRFLFYYMITGLGAGLIQEIVWAYELMPMLNQLPDSFVTPTGISMSKAILMNQFITIGASGAVFGILLAFGMLFPNAELYIMFIPIPVKAKYFVIFYGIVELILGVGNFTGDNIAHFAHLGGMLFGYILIKYWKKVDFNNGRYF